MMRKRFLLLLVVLTLVSGGFVGPQLYAQEEREGIGISPTTLTLSGDPGQQLTGQVTVLNAGTQPLRYQVYPSDFQIRNEAYEKDFEPSPDIASVADWFTLPEGFEELAPDAQATINYTIDIPSDAVSRGYYGVIFAETTPEDPDSSGVARRKRVGALIYLSVNGGLVQDGKVASFATDKWYRQSPVTAQLRLQNDGNVHFEAKGEVRLKNILGRTVSTAAVDGTIIPATTRNFGLELPYSRAFGLYKVEGEVNFLDKTTTLGSRWVLITSPVWLAILLGVLAVWIVSIVLRVKSRGKRKKH